MDLKEIECIIRLVEDSGIDELEVEESGTRIRVKKGGAPVAPVSYEHVLPAAPHPAPAAAPAPTPAADEAAEPAKEVPANTNPIKSPMVGTFYRSPTPDEAAYVQIGSQVSPDTVVCILEAMKVMNEIKAGCTGKVVEVLAENGQAVEFGQPLFLVASR